MRRLAPPLVSLVVVAPIVSCAAPSAPELSPIGRAASAVLKGRPSGEDENAAVYIETVGVDAQGSSVTLRCSGRIIAPGLAVTARHCLLKRKSENVRCNPDGSPVDIAEATDVRVEPPSAVTVFIGSVKPNLRPVAVREIFTELEINICRSDVAFVVLAEVGLDTRTPIRRTALRVSELVSISGWGYTSDDRTVLPDTRSTIERPIAETGPGVIPADAFALAGDSVCLGDSGAAALAGGALIGVYSRIENPAQCSLALNRNIFVWTGAHLDLATRAFAAIGEEPWYEGDRPPWLAKPGAPCTRDDECRSAVCDKATSTCSAPCGGDAKVACAAGKTCRADACVDPDPLAPAPTSATPSGNTGCAIGGAEATPVASTLLAVIVAVARRWLHRRRRSSY